MLGRFLIVVAAAVLSSAAVFPQQTLPSHTLTGTVSDSSGRKLPGVIVDLSRPGEASTVRTVVTDQTGRYRIDRVLPGSYVLMMRLPGFSSAIRDIEIGAGTEAFEYDVTLSPASASSQTVPAPQLPAKRVICGMTVITPEMPVDPKFVAPARPPQPDADRVKPTIRAVQPTLCWEPAGESPKK